MKYAARRGGVSQGPECIYPPGLSSYQGGELRQDIMTQLAEQCADVHLLVAHKAGDHNELRHGRADVHVWYCVTVLERETFARERRGGGGREDSGERGLEFRC